MEFMRVEEYVREDQSNPYKTWFDSLDSLAAARVATARSRLEMGNTSAVKWFQGIGEYRIDWGPGYRIYLVKEGDCLIILYGGGTKKTQPSDIHRAKEWHKEYQQRKRASTKNAKASEKDNFKIRPKQKK